MMGTFDHSHWSYWESPACPFGRNGNHQRVPLVFVALLHVLIGPQKLVLGTPNCNDGNAKCPMGIYRMFPLGGASVTYTTLVTQG